MKNNKQIPHSPEKHPKSVHELIASINKASMVQLQKLRMRRLVDRWSLTVFVLFSFIKVLQLCKKIGMRPREGGWRRAARAYLRGEHAKFTLAAFKLDIWSDQPTMQQSDLSACKNHVIHRLARFLKNMPPSHWEIHWHLFSAHRKRKCLIDIMQAEFQSDGQLTMIIPHIDPAEALFDEHEAQYESAIIQQCVSQYNALLHIADSKRPRTFKKRLHRWLLKQRDWPQTIRGRAKHYIHRVLSATFIRFEELRSTYPELQKDRFHDPHFIQYKHPGFGLLNILGRLSKGCTEVDLWIQFNHIPVDGVPMQEMLHKLKQEWGTRGELQFPAEERHDERLPFICTTTQGKNALYHVRKFFDFSEFLQVRKELNDRYVTRLGEDITSISMLIWGLAHHAVFHDRKFLCTVDIAECTITRQEREPSVVFIRPSVYFNRDDPPAGFLNFQLEFNRRLHATRGRRSESYELLELYAMNSPFVYWLTKKLLPKAMAEFVGTVGITMIKTSDVFLTPISDIHTDGFIAFGNFSVPTEDGRSAGAVSIRGPLPNVLRYLDALSEVLQNFHQYT